MAGKTDFTEDEWKNLQQGVTGAGLLVSTAHRDFTDSFGEASSIAKQLAQHRESDSQLVRELSGTHGCEREGPESDAEREGKCRGYHESGPDEGEHSAGQDRVPSPLACRDEGERSCGDGDRDEREQLDSEERRERVVEDAVRDERVAAAVPEVVPERPAVVREQRELVLVRGEVASGRQEHEEDRGYRERGTCGDAGLTCKGS